MSYVTVVVDYRPIMPETDVVSFRVHGRAEDVHNYFNGLLRLCRQFEIEDADGNRWPFDRRTVRAVVTRP